MISPVETGTMQALIGHAGADARSGYELLHFAETSMLPKNVYV